MVYFGSLGVLIVIIDYILVVDFEYKEIIAEPVVIDQILDFVSFSRIQDFH